MTMTIMTMMTVMMTMIMTKMKQGGKTVVSFSKKVKFIHKKIHSTIQVHFADKSSFIIIQFFQTDKGKYKAEDMVKLRLLVHDSFMRQIYLNLLKVKPSFILFFRPISSRLGHDAPKDSADDAGGSEVEGDGSGDEGSGEGGQHLEDIWISNGTIWVEVGQERVKITIKYVHSVGPTWPKGGPVES